MLVSTLVTPLDVTILLETILISPHTYELGGDLREGYSLSNRQSEHQVSKQTKDVMD